MQTQAVQLKTEGYTHVQIADELNVPVHTVPKLLADGLREYTSSRDEAVKKSIAIQTARYDRLFQKWMPRAIGRKEMVENKDGAMVEITHAPDPEAARIVASLMRDYGRMFGLNKIRVEHTGAGGGPILSHNFDWSMLTDEQLAQAASGNVEVLRALPGASASSGSARVEEAEIEEESDASNHH